MAEHSRFTVCGRQLLRIGIGGAKWSITDPQDDRPAKQILAEAIDRCPSSF